MHLEGSVLLTAFGTRWAAGEEHLLVGNRGCEQHRAPRERAVVCHCQGSWVIGFGFSGLFLTMAFWRICFFFFFFS